MKKTITILGLLITTTIYSQSVFNFDTYNTNDNLVEEVYDTYTLTTGTMYNLEVKGSYSIWAPTYYSSPCGAPESSPIYPSSGGTITGVTSSDMEYFFAYPTAAICSGKIFPDATARIEISLDNGVTWFHPTTTDPYNLAHTYNYQVSGQGYPLGVRHISALNSDDYGALRFTLIQATGINDFDLLSNALKIYPNPSNGLFMIAVNDFEEVGTVEVYNLMGQQVYSYTGTFNEHSIDLSNEKNGLYIVKYSNANGQFVERIIKQ